MQRKYEISLNSNEYYDLWKFEDHYMGNCWNMDQYSFKYKSSYLKIAKSANLPNPSVDQYPLML